MQPEFTNAFLVPVKTVLPAIGNDKADWPAVFQVNRM